MGVIDRIEERLEYQTAALISTIARIGVIVANTEYTQIDPSMRMMEKIGFDGLYL